LLTGQQTKEEGASLGERTERGGAGEGAPVIYSSQGPLIACLQRQSPAAAAIAIMRYITSHWREQVRRHRDRGKEEKERQRFVDVEQKTENKIGRE